MMSTPVYRHRINKIIQKKAAQCNLLTDVKKCITDDNSVNLSVFQLIQLMVILFLLLIPHQLLKIYYQEIKCLSMDVLNMEIIISQFYL